MQSRKQNASASGWLNSDARWRRRRWRTLKCGERGRGRYIFPARNLITWRATERFAIKRPCVLHCGAITSISYPRARRSRWTVSSAPAAPWGKGAVVDIFFRRKISRRGLAWNDSRSIGLAYCIVARLLRFLILGHDKADRPFLRLRRHHQFADRLEHLLQLEPRVLRERVVL